MFAGVTPSRRSAFTFLPRTVRRVTRSCVFAIFVDFAFVRFEMSMTVRMRDEGNKARSKRSNETYPRCTLSGRRSLAIEERRYARQLASLEELDRRAAARRDIRVCGAKSQLRAKRPV